MVELQELPIDQPPFAKHLLYPGLLVVFFHSLFAFPSFIRQILPLLQSIAVEHVLFLFFLVDLLLNLKKILDALMLLYFLLLFLS